jgi:hypothetical protein
MNEAAAEEEESGGATDHNERLPKRKDKWKCPRCGETVILHVKVSEPPVCRNPQEHTSTAVVMELVK